MALSKNFPEAMVTVREEIPNLICIQTAVLLSLEAE
ncbi:hypothetical protein SAMN05216299_12434 [Nitrosospira sp. Nsp14]|nr:hypothetical protein SAMN05216299_12434 [Nitrosospira sp. Nsp14]